VKAGGVAQVVEHLLNKHEAPSSNAILQKKKISFHFKKWIESKKTFSSLVAEETRGWRT
jgi:hypothetical protein